MCVRAMLVGLTRAQGLFVWAYGTAPGWAFGFAVALLSGRPSSGGVSLALGAALVAYREYSCLLYTSDAADE